MNTRSHTHGHCGRSLARSLVVLSSCLALLACSGDGSNDSDGALVPPLPSPPLTAAPDANDEPVDESVEFHVLSDLALVRDQGPALPAVQVADLTLADFNEGTPAPVLDIPPDVDPASNSAPFFEGLENQQLFAGDMLEIVYRPMDADGDIPGMFPNELPKGSSFDDNFDGSKTFRWQPLQRDVGIREFAVTAIDARNANYRYTQNIRLRIDLPEDQSGIPNVAPSLDRLPDFQFVARAGDAVVIELKGIDLNGSIPTIEVPDPPAGATFNADPIRSDVFVLKFTPEQTGQLSIDVLIRDSIDPSLVSRESVDIEVVSANFQVRTGERLATLAAARAIPFGFAASQDFYRQPDGALYAETASAEFNLVTPESSMKMDQINPLPGRYDFADTDNLITFANANGMAVHGHPLVWHRQLPNWILEAPIDDVEGHMREHIHRLMTRYRDEVQLWDVVNEPIDDNGGLRESVWFNAMGESYIDLAMRQARTSAPNATLLINEFDVGLPGPKADSFHALLDRLIASNTPLDGIGFQLHVFSSFDQFDDIRASFQRVADRDLDIYITELDVALADDGTEEQQARVFEQLVSLCVQQPRCRAIQTWGFTDQYSFRRRFNPLMFDQRYQEKPAYSAIQRALAP